MRSIFRNRRSNSESGASPTSTTTSARPGPEDAGPSRVTSRIPAPIQEDGEAERSPPIDIPGRDVQPPNYASQVATAPIPSYEVALSQSSPTSNGLLGSSLAQSPPPRSAFLDYRISSSNGPAQLGTSTGSRGCAIADDGDTDEDDPLVPRIIRPTPALNLVPLPQRRATFAAPERPSTPSPTDTPALPSSFMTLELPRPPPNALPAYSPHLLRDELRLISAVHLDQTHPAAAFFNHIATSFTSPGGAQREQLRALTTGGKKLKVTLTKGAEKMNNNGTGPIFIRLPRGGEVSGKIEVGKVDHATKLEVAIIGLVNTSYYIRGQYTLIDTLPLCRRMVVLYPPPAPESEESNAEEPTVTISADGIERSDARGTASATNGIGSEANGNATDSATPAVMDNEEIIAAAEPQVVGKDGLPFLAQGQTFEFNLKMPNHHYREGNIELPPTASIFQVGMQAGVEYVLRVKMTRKGWRLNETITVPIIYEPRAYVSPRRLRALTTDDAMNPGWRTIKLHGGEPTKTTTTTAAGVNVTLLLPSPPIVYVPWGHEAPPIPFHLHFHSSLPHALATFSDPKQCQFVIRLMRVATMRIGTEREIRRMEVPAKVEIWQEGGPKIVLSDPRAGTSSTAGASGVHPPGTSVSSPTTTTAGGTSVTSPATPGGSARRPSSSGGGETRRQSFLRRLSLDRSESRETPLQRQTSNAPATAPAVPPVAEEPEANQASSPSHGPTTPLNTDGTISQSPTDTTNPPLPPIADEGLSSPTAPNGEVSSTESPLAPLSLSSTDVHFLGQLTITYPVTGPELLRRLIQSFMTPEIGITYVLEVGLQPNAGSVKEAFKHVWGGGMVEIVLGARPTEPAADTSQRA